MTTPKRRPGRPPLTNPRRHTIRYRITDTEHAALTDAALAAGTTTTDYARRAALNAATNRTP